MSFLVLFLPVVAGGALSVATHARWLAWVASGLEVVVDDTTALVDEMSLKVMSTVEQIKARRLTGNELSVLELVDRFLDPICGDDQEKLTPKQHRYALAILAAVAVRYLANDG